MDELHATSGSAAPSRRAIEAALRMDAENYWCDNDGSDKASYLAGAHRALDYAGAEWAQGADAEVAR
jgi:hypothetical protein